MNKSDLIDAIASKTGFSKKDSGKAVEAFVEAVIEQLKGGGKVQLVGFGSFDVAHRAERQGVNPQDRTQKITIPASNAPRFRPGKAFKDAVNG